MVSESPVGESLALPCGGNNDSQELGERSAQSKHPAHRVKFLTETIRDQHQQIKLARCDEYGENSINPCTGLWRDPVHGHIGETAVEERTSQADNRKNLRPANQPVMAAEVKHLDEKKPKRDIAQGP